MTHDKLDGISFRRLFSALSSSEWKTWDKARVVTWLSDIFNTRDEKDRLFSFRHCHHHHHCHHHIPSPRPLILFLFLLYSSSSSFFSRSLIERVTRAFNSNDIDGRMLAHMTKVTPKNRTLNPYISVSSIHHTPPG